MRKTMIVCDKCSSAVHPEHLRDAGGWTRVESYVLGEAKEMHLPDRQADLCPSCSHAFVAFVASHETGGGSDE